MLLKKQGKCYYQSELYFKNRLINMFSLTKRFSGYCETDKKERGALLVNLTEYHPSVSNAKETLVLTLSGPDSNGQTKADLCGCSGGQMAFPGHGWNIGHRFLYSGYVTTFPVYGKTVNTCANVKLSDSMEVCPQLTSLWGKKRRWTNIKSYCPLKICPSLEDLFPDVWLQVIIAFSHSIKLSLRKSPKPENCNARENIKWAKSMTEESSVLESSHWLSHLF